MFDKYGPGESFRLTVAGKPMYTRVGNNEASIQFGPIEESQQSYFFPGNLGKDPAFVFGGGIRIAPPTAAEQRAIKQNRDWMPTDLVPIDAARLKTISYLQINKPLRRPVLLETGPLRTAMSTLDRCVDNLVSTWGVDVERHKTLSRGVTPKENPGTWINSYNYPMEMLAAGQPAIVEFRLIVGIDGKPAACHIQSTTRPKAFDDAVCDSLMRRAKFSPALDAQNQPLMSYWRNTVRFQIPR